MKSHGFRKLIFCICLGVGLLHKAPVAWAQVEVNDAEMNQKGEREVGKEAAQDYFKERRRPASKKEAEGKSPSIPKINRGPAQASGDHYLALTLGTFIDDKSYSWGDRGQEDVGKFNAGVTYRLGEWVGSMDLLFRADFQSFKLNEGRANKLSIMPLVLFPESNSRFPLYFGGGAGLGVFFKQVHDESSLSFDYQLLIGARFFDLVENMGFLVETGVKNHIFLLSDGQFNSVFFALGLVFQF